jgi:protein-disulfide isomerase
VGGASRNARKRRQQEADRRLAAAGITPPKRGNRTALVVVALVVAVALGFGVTQLLDRTADIPANYPVALDGTVVTAGQASAPVTVDVYEDYLCPQCERFEERYGNEITTALNEGRIRVNYHSIAILDRLTTPPGYSTLAANAGICAAQAGIWPAFHARLFADQPAEGGAGLTAAQLAGIGTELGAPAGFEQCVTANGGAAAIAAATQGAASNPALQWDGRFGTPTVAVDGRKVDLNDTGWLQNATNAG